MNLEWIDDLLAVIDSGSLSNAAQRRFITQPAFSRRIRAIEKNMGITLIDRARKPVQAEPSLIAMETRLREASQLLHELKKDMSNASNDGGELILAGQHALTTTLAPQLVKSVGADGDRRIRLRSANRDECLSLLFTRQVDIALLYQLTHEPASTKEPFVDSHQLGHDLLIPIVAANDITVFEKEIQNTSLRIVAYPRDVFLGDVLYKKILPHIDEAIEVRPVSETALTSAAIQLALAGNGVAWVPLSLAQAAIDRGEIIRLDEKLPIEHMSVVALKLVQHQKESVGFAWECIVNGNWV